MTTWEVGEGELEMERSSKKTSLGQVLGERLEQVFCHDSALVLDITVEVDIVLAVLLGTVCLCECFLGFRDGICDLGRPPGFSRAVDAAERNGRSGSIIKEFGTERKSFAKLEGGEQWVSI